MSVPLTLACLWVLAASLVALLPVRRQYLPGMVLLAGAAVLMVWIAREHGAVPVLAGLAVLISMFRKPLRYLVLRTVGRAPARHD